MKTPPFIAFAFTRWVIKIVHIHTGSNDYSLFWWVRGTGVMDIFFFRIK